MRQRLQIFVFGRKKNLISSATTDSMVKHPPTVAGRSGFAGSGLHRAGKKAHNGKNENRLHHS